MKNKPFYKRQHLFVLSRKIRLSAVLLLIPVVQQILLSPTGIIQIIASLSLGTLWSAAVVTYGILSYRRQRHRITDDGIKIRSGIFFGRTFTIPFRRILTLTFRQTVFQRLMGAVDVIPDTPARFNRSGNITLCLSSKAALAVRKILSGTKSDRYRCDPVRILLMAAFRSNPASGLLLLAPVVYRLGNLYGFSWEQQAAARFREGLPIPMTAGEISAAAGLTARIMLLGWCVALVVRFLGYSRFSSHAEGNFIVSARGILTRILSFSRKDAISAVTLDSTLLMHLFGLCSVSVFTIGSGKKGADKSMILPSDTKCNAHQMLHTVFGIQEKELVCVRAERILAYLRLPLCFLLADGAFLTFIFFRFGFSACAMVSLSVLPLLWWCLFRWAAYKESYLSVCENCLHIGTFSGLTLRQYYIPFKKIQQFRITQNPFQKKSGTCSVCLYLYFEKKVCLKIRQLPLEITEKIAAAQV